MPSHTLTHSLTHTASTGVHVGQLSFLTGDQKTGSEAPFLIFVCRSFMWQRAAQRAEPCRTTETQWGLKKSSFPLHAGIFFSWIWFIQRWRSLQRRAVQISLCSASHSRMDAVKPDMMMIICRKFGLWLKVNCFMWASVCTLRRSAGVFHWVGPLVTASGSYMNDPTASYYEDVSESFHSDGRHDLLKKERSASCEREIQEADHSSDFVRWGEELEWKHKQHGGGAKTMTSFAPNVETTS